MKCPKCNFISFDYNDACPKCGKGLTHERELMNLPSYKPKPFSLLLPLNAYSQIRENTTRDGRPRLVKESMDEVPGELLIPLDDLSDYEPVPIQMESDPIQTEPSQQIDDETLGEKMADTKFDDASEKTPELFLEKEARGGSKGLEPVMELELEPLEFDFEIERPGKKTT